MTSFCGLQRRGRPSSCPVGDYPPAVATADTGTAAATNCPRQDWHSSQITVGPRPHPRAATTPCPGPPPIQAQPPQPTVRGRIGMPCRLLNVPRPHLSFLEERPSISPPGARRLNGGER